MRLQRMHSRLIACFSGALLFLAPSALHAHGAFGKGVSDAGCCCKQGDGKHLDKVGRKGNNGLGNGLDPQPPGAPRINDGIGAGPGNPGNRGGPGGKLGKMNGNERGQSSRKPDKNAQAGDRRVEAGRKNDVFGKALGNVGNCCCDAQQRKGPGGLVGGNKSGRGGAERGKPIVDGRVGGNRQPVANGNGVGNGRANGKGGPKGNNGIGNGFDGQPPGNPRINDGAATGRGNPGNKGGPGGNIGGGTKGNASAPRAKNVGQNTFAAANRGGPAPFQVSFVPGGKVGGRGKK